MFTMVEEMRIEDTLDGIKRIITSYYDTIDYSDYIRDLEKVLEKLNVLKKNSKDLKSQQRLAGLEDRTKFYLSRMRAFQAHYENQENHENV